MLANALACAAAAAAYYCTASLYAVVPAFVVVYGAAPVWHARSGRAAVRAAAAAARRNIECTLAPTGKLPDGFPPASQLLALLVQNKSLGWFRLSQAELGQTLALLELRLTHDLKEGMAAVAQRERDSDLKEHLAKDGLKEHDLKEQTAKQPEWSGPAYVEEHTARIALRASVEQGERALALGARLGALRPARRELQTRRFSGDERALRLARAWNTAKDPLGEASGDVPDFPPPATEVRRLAELAEDTERMLVSIHGDVFDVSSCARLNPVRRFVGHDITYAACIGSLLIKDCSIMVDVFKFPADVVDSKLKNVCQWRRRMVQKYPLCFRLAEYAEGEEALPFPPQAYEPLKVRRPNRGKVPVPRLHHRVA